VNSNLVNSSRRTQVVECVGGLLSDGGGKIEKMIQGDETKLRLGRAKAKQPKYGTRGDRVGWRFSEDRAEERKAKNLRSDALNKAKGARRLGVTLPKERGADTLAGRAQGG